MLVCSFSKLFKLVHVLSGCTECLCKSGCNCFWINDTNIFEMTMLYLQSVAGSVEAVFISILILVSKM